MAENRTATPLVIWYNTLCPVCKTGIDVQTRLMREAVRSGTVEFRDINENLDVLEQLGASLEEVRKRLHARTSDGRVLKGAEVVQEVMRCTPGFSVVGKSMSLPGLSQLSGAAYDGFAELLYATNRRAGRW